MDEVPDYREFLTVKELDDSSRRLASENPSIEYKKIGESIEGRPISYLKIGEGENKALLFAFPHPNEPIGSMTLEFLSGYLAENREVLDELGYTWYLVKAVDPDGAALNEGWFKGEFTPLKYARNYYRPPGHEQIEWTFPVDYKNLHFHDSPPETRALMSLIDEVKPDFMFSLHNAGFCGVYYYISHPLEQLYEGFTSLVEEEGLPLHKGEPEAPFIETLHPAVFRMFGIQSQYEFYEENGVVDPSTIIKSGTSSHDYLQRVTGGRGFTLVCEMPYFYDKALEDDSPTMDERRDLVLDSLKFSETVYSFVESRFSKIKDLCRHESRIYRSVSDYIENFQKRHEPRMHHAKTTEDYQGKATVAQSFDSKVARRYYQSFIVAMTSRLCDEAIERHPEKKRMIGGIKDELDEWVSSNVESVLEETAFRVIPIKKLVRVQTGSALITMQNL
ncbi:MAG: M14 family zinc carboxypeptidase [Candidatus Bathyarchaeia archaeon]